MSATTRFNVVDRLSLTARNSAARFAATGRRRRRATCGRVVLRWRRWHRSPALRNCGQVTITSSQNWWQLHFHLHFAARERHNHEVPRGATLALVLATRRHARAIARGRETVTRMVESGLPPRRLSVENARFDQSPLQPTSRWRRADPELRIAGTLPEPLPGREAAVRRSHASSRHHPARVVPASIEHPRMVPANRSGGILRRQLPRVLRRTVARVLAAPVADGAPARRARAHLPPDLQWRQLATAGAEMLRPDLRNEVPVLAPVQSAGAANPPISRPISAGQPQVAKTIHLTDLDPRLVDRLTDDVIRRVERRVRIERERRGL
jgi:hypothetical protein